MTERHGDWTPTYTGKKFWPLDPRPEDVDVEDIAHALSMKCRYAGHTTEFYSVAQHSVLMAQKAIDLTADVNLALWCMLHDAAEAYTADIPSPLKPYMHVKHPVSGLVPFDAVEQNIREVIRQALAPELRFHPPQRLHDLDQRIRVDEATALMRDSAEWVSWMGGKLDVVINSWAPSTARQSFLGVWDFLREGRTNGR